MESRRDTLSDAFKQARNRAGETVFVAPDQVEGTLARGFEFYSSLETPLYQLSRRLAEMAAVAFG